MKKTALLLALALCTGNSYAASLLQSRAEQVTSIPITNGVTVNQKQLFSVCSKITADTAVQVNAQSEVTNPYSFNVGIGYVIKAWDYYVDDAGASTFIRSYNAIPAVMSNATPAEHHYIVNVAAAEKVSYASNANTRCYTLVAWAVSSSGSGDIIVQQGYGYLQVVTLN